ncbi:MAG: hypothetical protein U1E76_06805 [Planctomycetota bacterium]
MRTTLLFVCWVLGSSPLFASIIIVDQTSIQDAIDGARDGDVILVKGYADYVYGDFTIDGKAVAVRSFGGLPFLVSDLTYASVTVVIRNIATGKRASVSGMVLRIEEYAADISSLEVTDCAGEVVIEDISVPNKESYHSHGGRSELKISHCDNVSVNGFVNQFVFGAPQFPTVSIDHSQVRMTDVSITGETDYGGSGGNAFLVTDSFLVLANPHVSGASGEKETGAPGGDGVYADLHSLIIVLGDATDSITGGGGGDSHYESPWGYVGPGGDGGDGLHCVVRDGESSVALVSKVGLSGGGGGKGDPNGNGGQAFTGDVTRNDVMPHLALTTDLVPGGSGVLTLHNVVAGSFLILVATQGGFLPVGGIIGPPISAVPGGLFLAVPLPHVGADGSLDLPFVLPNDPDLRGLPLELQAVLLGDDALVYSTQAIARVIGQ